MKCPTCEGEGQKSNVYPGGTFSTLMFNHPYWDADGVYQSLDFLLLFERPRLGG
jgi:hypothetical protein